MSRRDRPRSRAALGLALGATLAATWWAATLDTAPEPVATAQRGGAPRPAEAAAPVAPPPVAAASAASAAASGSARAPWPEPAASALAAWMPPPPPPPPPAPVAAPMAPPPPVAPPFPYQLIGRLDEGGKPVALLAGPSRTVAAREGEVLDGQWRVQSVQPSGVQLVWLPAQLPQSIAFRPLPL